MPFPLTSAKAMSLPRGGEDCDPPELSELYSEKGTEDVSTVSDHREPPRSASSGALRLVPKGLRREFLLVKRLYRPDLAEGERSPRPVRLVKPKGVRCGASTPPIWRCTCKTGQRRETSMFGQRRETSMFQRFDDIV